MKRLAFTLVELLIVIAIIGILVAILLPAISAVREAGRRTACMNNLRQLSLAVLNYEQTQKKFPGYRNIQAIDAAGRRRNAGWLFPLLPHLESKSVFEAYGPRGPAATRGRTPTLRLPGVTCPSDYIAEDRIRKNWYTATSYVANVGQWDVAATRSAPPDWRANGLFLDQLPFGDDGRPVRVETTSAKYVTAGDGLSKTLMLSENVDAGFWPDALEASIGFGWEATIVNGEPRPTTLLRINELVGEYWRSQLAQSSLLSSVVAFAERSLPNGHPPGGPPTPPPDQDPDPLPDPTGSGPQPVYPLARPSSFHSGGVLATYADGHVQFLREDIAYLTYCALMTPRGAASLLPGTMDPVPDVYRTARTQGIEAE
jgi:prepilin-type N-terminal cleavage/methylation domain-containing protein/prepilin-type processing-associated H-X9-DG protein